METAKSYSFSAQKVMTRGVASTIPLHLQLLMWKMIYDLKITRDYLQVFQLSIKNGQQMLVHTQEVPPYKREYVITPATEPATAKIFVIDDESVVTMLLAEEY